MGGARLLRILARLKAGAGPAPGPARRCEGCAEITGALNPYRHTTGPLDRPLGAVAADVVARRLRFSASAAPGQSE